MAKRKMMITVGVFILLLIGGYKLVEQREVEKKEQQRIEQMFWDEQKIRIEKFIQYNFNDIESVTFTETYKTPMSVGIHGYVNGDKENMNFIAPIYNEEDDFNTGLTTSEKLSFFQKIHYIFFSNRNRRNREN